jgi:CheY-like chemotaxis protein
MRMTHETQAQATLLIAEDDRMTAESIAEMLTNEGYLTHAASDGEECIHLIKASPPNLILMDTGLPVKNGIDTCRELRSDPAFQMIPVVFIAADTNDETLAMIFDAGGSDYVRKPVNRIELLTRVSCALTRQLVVEKLAEEQKLEAVLETAGDVCHKLNQPLQYILGSLQILLMDIEPDDAMRTSLEAILQRVEHMGEITGKLADISRFRTRESGGGLNRLDIDQYLKKPSSSD